MHRYIDVSFHPYLASYFLAALSQHRGQMCTNFQFTGERQGVEFIMINSNRTLTDPRILCTRNTSDTTPGRALYWPMATISSVPVTDLKQFGAITWAMTDLSTEADVSSQGWSTYYCFNPLKHQFFMHLSKLKRTRKDSESSKIKMNPHSRNFWLTIMTKPPLIIPAGKSLLSLCLWQSLQCRLSLMHFWWQPCIVNLILLQNQNGQTWRNKCCGDMPLLRDQMSHKTTGQHGRPVFINF